jgi:hypothetical protein
MKITSLLDFQVDVDMMVGHHLIIGGMIEIWLLKVAGLPWFHESSWSHHYSLHFNLKNNTCMRYMTLLVDMGLSWI